MQLTKSFLLLVSILFFISCSNSTEIEQASRGSILKSELLITLSPDDIKSVLQSNGYEPTLAGEIVYSVDVIKVEYRSINIASAQTILSGVYMIPKYESDFPLLSIQHGTVFNRNNVASENLNGVGESLSGMILASQGFFVTIPDYIGYGISNDIHPYIHAKSSSSSVIDMLRSAKHYASQKNIELNGQLFLYGYSQGGYVTLASQKEIEEKHLDEFNLTAVSPLAGPYDILSTAETIFTEKTYKYLNNLAFIFTSYNSIYNWGRLDDIFLSPYAEKMEQLFDGTKTNNEILNELPENLTDLIKPEFITSFLNGSETEIENAFKENSLLGWSPKTPIRFYHGDNDDEVPYQNAVNAVELLKKKSATVIEFVTIEGDHQSANLPAVLGALSWFKSLKK